MYIYIYISPWACTGNLKGNRIFHCVSKAGFGNASLFETKLYSMLRKKDQSKKLPIFGRQIVCFTDWQL